MCCKEHILGNKCILGIIIARNDSSIPQNNICKAINYIRKKKKFRDDIPSKVFIVNRSDFVSVSNTHSNKDNQIKEPIRGNYIPQNQSDDNKEYIIINACYPEDHVLSSIVHEVNHSIDYRHYDNIAFGSEEECCRFLNVLWNMSEMKSKYYQNLFLLEVCHHSNIDEFIKQLQNDASNPRFLVANRIFLDNYFKGQYDIKEVLKLSPRFEEPKDLLRQEILPKLFYEKDLLNNYKEYFDLI